MKTEVGQIVRVTAGRDKEKYMIIVGLSGDDYVLLCDGNIRKISHPKKKNKKHIAMTKTIVYPIKDRLLSGQKIQNADLRRFLAPWNDRSGDHQVKED